LNKEEKEKNRDQCIQRHKVVKGKGQCLTHQGVQMIKTGNLECGNKARKGGKEVWPFYWDNKGALK
jgi:hypothetical protein